MKTYRRTFIISTFITVIAFLVSMCFIGKTSKWLIWGSNIMVGIFASGILLVVSSFIGYSREEEKVFAEFKWKLSELKGYALELQTHPPEESSPKDYYENYKNIYNILINYFAIVDMNFMFCWRAKVQIIIEIRNKLFALKEMSYKAIIKYREYICGKKDEDGNRLYSVEAFNNDLKDVISSMNNYDNSGKILTVWIESKEIEYHEVVWGKKSKKLK